MKKLLLSFMFVLLSGVVTQTAFEAEAKGKQEPAVYVCSSRSAKCYHASTSCRGIKRCRSKIVSMPRSSAAKKGYKPCKICY